MMDDSCKAIRKAAEKAVESMRKATANLAGVMNECGIDADVKITEDEVINAANVIQKYCSDKADSCKGCVYNLGFTKDSCRLRSTFPNEWPTNKEEKE